MDDAQVVDVRQGVGHSGADHCQFIQRDRAVPDPAPEVLPLNQFHSEERTRLLRHAGVYSGVEQSHEAGVVQGGEQLDLGFLTLQLVRVG
ncbi:hypothetical protein D9M68_926440 [compost metagenome]